MFTPVPSDVAIVLVGITPGVGVGVGTDTLNLGVRDVVVRPGVRDVDIVGVRLVGTGVIIPVAWLTCSWLL